jgi:hypothetical protein
MAVHKVLESATEASIDPLCHFGFEAFGGSGGGTLKSL